MQGTIDQTKLEELRDALIANPALSDAKVAKITGRGNEGDYYAALTEQWPDKFPPQDPEEEETAPPAAVTPVPAPAVKSPTAPKAAPFSKAIVQRHADGSTTSYRVVTETGSTLLIEEDLPKDLVTVTLGGKPVELDVNELKRLPGNSEAHGRPVASLLQLCELSR